MKEIENETGYIIDPKGAAITALLESNLISDTGDPRVDLFWAIFEAIMTYEEDIQGGFYGKTIS